MSPVGGPGIHLIVTLGFTLGGALGPPSRVGGCYWARNCLYYPDPLGIGVGLSRGVGDVREGGVAIARGRGARDSCMSVGRHG